MFENLFVQWKHTKCVVLCHVVSCCVMLYHAVSCCIPQVIYDLIRSHDGVDAGKGDGGGNENTNRAAVELSRAFRDHVFCLDRSRQLEIDGTARRTNRSPQAVGLTIEVLNFLRGRQVC